MKIRRDNEQRPSRVHRNRKSFLNKCRKTLCRDGDTIVMENTNSSFIHATAIRSNAYASHSPNVCQQTTNAASACVLYAPKSWMLVFVISPEAKCHLNLQFLKRQSFFCFLFYFSFGSMVTMMSISTLSSQCYSLTLVYHFMLTSLNAENGVEAKFDGVEAKGYTSVIVSHKICLLSRL